jgi:cytochrome c oxidase assembly protein subunit 11
MNPRGKRLAASLSVGIVVAMLGLAFSAPYLYSTFCRVTGYGGTTGRASAAPGKILDRRIQVSFDTNVAPGLALDFKAKQGPETIRVGETALAFFEVTNRSGAPIKAVAAYNVAPAKVGRYFRKLECFCFKERTFQPGQTMALPVVFFVDPALADDLDAQEVQQITLSYTYFPVRTEAALQLPDAARTNGRTP